MKKIILSLLSFYSLAALSAADCPKPAQKNLENSKVLVFVEGESWDSSDAKLTVYTKGENGFWVKSKDRELVDQDAFIGKNGLGWGPEYHDQQALDPSQAGSQFLKQEGDRKSPAGVFSIGEAFGALPRPTDANYIQIMREKKAKDSTEGMRTINGKKMIPTEAMCSDDIEKPAYYDKIWKNDISKFVKKNSGELLGGNPLYTCGLNVLTGSKVDYATTQTSEEGIEKKVVNGRGSCIFVHHFDEALYQKMAKEIKSQCQDKATYADCKKKIEWKLDYHEAGTLATYGCTALHQKNMCHLMEFVENPTNQGKVAFSTLPKSELQKASWRSCFPGVDLPEPESNGAPAPTKSAQKTVQ